MNDVISLGLALFSGVALGGLFFGGLWWTVQKLAATKRPVRLLLASLLVRTAVVLAGFFLVGGASWPRLLACLLGFTAARFLVKGMTAGERAPHAP